jgi:L-ribulose-5-phosphate 3-epimerase UlaE
MAAVNASLATQAAANEAKQAKVNTLVQELLEQTLHVHSLCFRAHVRYLFEEFMTLVRRIYDGGGGVP